MAAKKKKAGRRSSVPSAAAAADAAQAVAGAAEAGVSPLEFLLGIMRDDNMDLATRIGAAKTAVPYVHDKPASATIEAPDLERVAQAFMASVERVQDKSNGVSGLLKR